ncbi:hypothetical protein O181_050722 [Austropuccinia psidii MF-1]|uniref:Transfer RNA methyltransferase 82 n=1 Tax=Austropuccinia psidii MF-1 TaxID=1389203 RepID=A0A9Q3E487_9BASI|nr:hypothetical protein [Austropuccinia psidii MF-1]
MIFIRSLSIPSLKSSLKSVGIKKLSFESSRPSLYRPLSSDIVRSNQSFKIEIRGIMTKLPCQQLILTPSKDLIIIAFGCHLQVFDAANGNLISSTLSTSDLNPQGSNHTGFIRLLAVHHQSLSPNSNQSLKLISTGEDKLLKIWQLPNLKLIQSRELIKRPTSIAISPNGENIVIADKFGDVYDLPFDAPLQTIFQSDPDQEQISEKIEKSISLDQPSTKTDPSKPTLKSLAPIAGHVSVLTSLAFIPSTLESLLVTADRDEHIRISRYPQAWSIVGYLLGHTKFVSALLWLNHLSNDPLKGRLLSGGGDNQIFVWDTYNRLCEQKIPLEGLASGMKVWPLKQTWFSKSRNNKRRRAQDKSIDATEDGSGKESAEETKQVEQTSKLIQRTCINKLLCTQSSPHDKETYVLVTSVGSSTIAIIPLSAILAPSSSCDKKVQYYDFGAPVLDLVNLPDQRILVSLDTTFSPTSSGLASSSASLPSFRALDLNPNHPTEISESAFPLLGCLNQLASIDASAETIMPTHEVLYPELLLFTKDELNSNANSQSHPFDLSRSGGRSGKKEEGRQLVSNVRSVISLRVVQMPERSVEKSCFFFCIIKHVFSPKNKTGNFLKIRSALGF